MTPPDNSTTSTTGGTTAAPTRRRVLIVDDADDIRTLVRLVLSTSPRFDVVGEAKDGHEAIEQTQQLRPDLVLLDLSMPGMDGLEALPHLRALGATVIVLSGYATHVMADRALKAGAMGYLEKGGSPREIIDALEELLGHDDGPPT